MKRFFKLLLLTGLLLTARASFAQPTFLLEPVDQAVSPGAQILLQGVAYGLGTPEYQWYKDDQPLAGFTSDFLFIPSVNAADAGHYFVVATILSQSTTSGVAIVSIDNRFTKITTGALVGSPTISIGSVWNDYDNDGDPDVFVARAGISFNQLFRNDGNGVFTPIAAGDLSTDLANSQTASWTDYDNDGRLDMLVVNAGTPSTLYHNNGDDTFSRTNAGPLGMEPGNNSCAAWGDANHDGFLDLYIGNGFGAGFYYQNKGDGTFTRITNGTIAGSGGFIITASVSWGDSDNDGDADLLLGNQGFAGFLPGHEVLFVNDGTGLFSQLQDDPLVNSGGVASSCSWIDIDNDLDLDAVLINTGGENSAVFRNEGNNQFTPFLAGDLSNNGELGGQSTGSAWGDFDNDGWIDVMVANLDGNNFLYHNNGDGTFTRIATGSPANDGGSSLTCAFVDYDRDGFLDLNIANAGQADFLYRNNGNSNSWIAVRCSAFNKNRFGVGAKIKVLATIGGTARWQMREISARDALGGTSTLEAHFGLGDATSIDTLRIEWPSGSIEELTNVAVDQFLVVGEPSLNATSITVSEGDVGPRVVQVPVILGEATNGTVTVEYFTRPSTAITGLDYLPAVGMLTFAPGQVSNSVSVSIQGDLIDEPNEVFFVVLTNASGSTISSMEARVTIADDDPLVVAMNDTQITEGDSGTTDAIYTVFLSKASDLRVSATYRTVDGSAVAGVDFVGITSGLVVFEPGETSKTVTVQIINDVVSEQSLFFGLRLQQGTNATVNRRSALCTIFDNDPSPTLRVEDAVVWEGTAGSAMATITVNVLGEFRQAITVQYETLSNTAEPNADYVPQASQLTINPGTNSATFTVPITNDSVSEPAETFLVQLSNPVNATIARDRSVARIYDDDIQVSTPRPTTEGFRFAFFSMLGVHYRVEWRAALTSGNDWMPLTGYENVAGTGALIQVLDPAALSAGQRFYQIVVQP